MIYRLVTAPATAPLTVAEAKSWLRVEHDADDAVISDLIAAAVGLLDGRDGILGRCLEPQTWEAVFDGFPYVYPYTEMRLTLGPVASVESVTYRDADGATQTLPAEGYSVVQDGLEARVRLAEGFSWPSTAVHPQAVVIRYVAGVGTPPAIRQAIKQMVAATYETREGGAMMTPGVLRELAPYRRVRL